MNFFKYSVFDLDAIKAHEEPHVLISIRTPGAPRANIRSNVALLDVLFIEFPDLDERYLALPGVKQYRVDDLFGRAHAATILEFVERHKNDVESVLVQCEGGLSRSVAIKIALAQIYNGDNVPYTGTNRLVYRTMLEVAKK